MTRELRWVRIRDEKDFRASLDDLRKDRVPRLIQDDEGKVIAVLMDPDEFAKLTKTPKSRMNRERILSLIGSWKDLDAEELIADIYRWRDEAPPSPDPSIYFDNEETEYFRKKH
jgi:hypothetical protein